MKKITLLLIIPCLFLHTTCKKDKMVSEITEKPSVNCLSIDQYVMDNYYNDARDIYFTEILNDEHHPNYLQKTLNEEEIISVLGHIQAVYNLNLPEKDTVFFVSEIHTRYCYAYQSINIKVNPDLPEIQNLVNHVIPTGNEQLDAILAEYQFDSVSTFYSYPSFPWITLHTQQIYNMIPAEKDLNKIAAIELAELSGGCVGDGNQIQLTRSTNPSQITFSIGSGDCPAGCIYHRYWEFEVDDCKALFIRTYEN